MFFTYSHKQYCHYLKHNNIITIIRILLFTKLLFFLSRFACDVRVIRLLRERGLGNSPTRVLKQLKENHTEEWLNRVARYTTECLHFLQRPGLFSLSFPEPPEPAVVPSCKWLLSVYSKDILTRLDDIKARITSTYGTIIKMDSTKKVRTICLTNILALTLSKLIL